MLSWEKRCPFDNFQNDGDAQLSPDDDGGVWWWYAGGGMDCAPP